MTQSSKRAVATYVSFAAYVERELLADSKSEYRRGAVCPMTTCSIDHARVIRNLVAELSKRLGHGRCEAFESSLRVYVEAADSGFYPDAQIICGRVEYYTADRNRTTVLNPSVVFEVLSPGTSSYDRGEKMRAYLSIPTLKQYVLIEYTTPYVEVLTRRDDGWLRTDASGIDAVVTLESIGVALSLSELYLGVNFPPPEPAPESFKQQ